MGKIPTNSLGKSSELKLHCFCLYNAYSMPKDIYSVGIICLCLPCRLFCKSVVSFKSISELKQKNVSLIFSRPKPLPRVTPALETVKQFAIKIVFYLLFQIGSNWFLKEHSAIFITDKNFHRQQFNAHAWIFSKLRCMGFV